MKETPLSKLIVEEGELDEQFLHDLLEPYIRFRKTGELSFTENYPKLTKYGKIIVLLLSQKAKARLIKNENEKLRPIEIVKISGVSRKTVDSALDKFKKRGLTTSEEKKHFIPNYSLPSVKKFLERQKLKEKREVKRKRAPE